MLNFEIDKLTNSIENAVTGEVFETLILQLTTAHNNGLKKKEWIFDWKKELGQKNREVYKLVTSQDQRVIQGLISLSCNQDHIFMHLIENARFNKGPQKMYLGIAGNLVAFACKRAFENNFNGIVVFEAKTKLITYYQLSIGAKILAGNRMFIDSNEAHSLVKRYF